ncbi:hypothetical protein ACFVVU_31740 [Kitasatospora sp. NPDC057965]|uniref:hypothetical protein n=1 Tax=Kitasatospora sp. NPDC057965 TaxID=3346291 RepID=UPI0036DF8D3A
MNCLDRTQASTPAPTVSICRQCGAGAYPAHSEIRPVTLTRPKAINRTVAVTAQARTLHCSAHTATLAAHRTCCPPFAGAGR